MPDPTACPCGLGLPFAECCGRLLAGAPAPTAEALMRSRFTAFARRDEPYLLRTWHPRTRPRRIQFDAGQRWTRLAIVDRRGGALLDQDGVVEFVAHYTLDGQPGTMRERSQFVRHDGVWSYLGVSPDPGDVGRL